MTEDIAIGAKTGKLFEMKDIYCTKDEIEVLAESFDDLSKKTKKYIEDITAITAEKERIGTELSIAMQIQASLLPHTFPPYPERREFDIYAEMRPAKEVSGDFYDFFLIDSDHLCLVMADVSGKGIPAALFMMISKTLLKSNASLGQSPAEILTKTNESLCADNPVEMFVTVWLGILEISTGKLTAANAGHEYPVLKRKNGSFELFKDKHSFGIGGMDSIRYKEYELQLYAGDKLFLYTDGIPEASNADDKMFGLEQMLAALNLESDAAPKTLLANVHGAVSEFVGDAEQFDDLTMLCMEYNGSEETEE
ncbi:MAG: PP2C family protein-serine/threonine phosphatase [Oscillospiraceae bacterium]|nr:PP2C family protein-serine/threonine phosphatase [Oscillospiraceae bacterium]